MCFAEAKNSFHAQHEARSQNARSCKATEFQRPVRYDPSNPSQDRQIVLMRERDRVNSAAKLAAEIKATRLLQAQQKEQHKAETERVRKRKAELDAMNPSARAAAERYYRRSDRKAKEDEEGKADEEASQVQCLLETVSERCIRLFLWILRLSQCVAAL